MIPDVDSLETTRLRAERVGEGHFRALRTLWQNEQVMSFVGGVRDEQSCRTMMQAIQEHWERYGFGRWAWFEKSTGAFVGMAGFRCMTVDEWPEVTFGYLLAPEFWGRGYATEISEALLSLAFERLGTESLIALVMPENTASLRVLEKIGMKYNREGTFEKLPHLLYEIIRADWRARHNLP